MGLPVFGDVEKYIPYNYFTKPFFYEKASIVSFVIWRNLRIITPNG
jgi:hypothetical protein